MREAQHLPSKVFISSKPIINDIESVKELKEKIRLSNMS